MSPFVIFRIIGWFLIVVASISSLVIVYQVEQGEFGSVVAILGILVNLLTIWFIYTAMQI
jgi:Co/Zn/Cd efflux system component